MAIATNISGSAVRLLATGCVNETITWHSELRVRKLST